VAECKIPQNDKDGQIIDEIASELCGLSNGFENIVKPHMNILTLLSQFMIDADTVFDDLGEEQSKKMSGGLIKIIFDTVDSLEDFENRLDLVFTTFRANNNKNKDYPELFKTLRKEHHLESVLRAVEMLEPEGRGRVIEHIKELNGSETVQGEISD